jgi:hypothetical protein
MLEEKHLLKSSTPIGGGSEWRLVPIILMVSVLLSTERLFGGRSLVIGYENITF